MTDSHSDRKKLKPQICMTMGDFDDGAPSFTHVRAGKTVDENNDFGKCGSVGRKKFRKTEKKD